MKKIVNHPAPVLRVKTEPVIVVDKKLEKQTKDLIEVLGQSKGVGLAAPQIGMERRFFAFKDEESKKVSVLINPEIKAVAGEKSYPQLVGEKEEKEDFLEGCLSFPNYWGTVKRYLRIKAVWQELKEGKLIEKGKTFEGLEAIVFQHELDHLDGILFVDRIKEEGGKFYRWVGEKMVKWNLDEVIKGNL